MTERKSTTLKTAIAALLKRFGWRLSEEEYRATILDWKTRSQNLIRAEIDIHLVGNCNPKICALCFVSGEQPRIFRRRGALLMAAALSIFLSVGCGGGSRSMLPPNSPLAADSVSALIKASFSLAANPNPQDCKGFFVSINGFGGCPLNAYRPNVGRVWEFVDTFTTPHHLFVRQETAPGFDGATGIVWHYSKADFITGQRVPGDDGMGYWCSGDPTAELYFGLTYKDATPAAAGGWYSTHQTYRCNGDVRTTDISGPGYLIIADLPGDTGPVSYSMCSRLGVWIDDPTAWTPTTCTRPQTVGWNTDMARTASGGLPITIQSEGPQVLGCAPTGTLACRFWAVEGWTVSGGDMQAIQVVDNGNGPAKTPAWLSMKLANVTN